MGILNYADTFCGLQSGFLNISGESFMGLQASLINCAHDLYGLQCGSYLIIGVNGASGTVRGCQIGLLNIISQNGWLPVLPIVNGHF